MRHTIPCTLIALGTLSAGAAEARRAGGGSLLPRHLIKRVVRTKSGEVRRCYVKGLARDPTLRGKVVIRFTIAPSGKVVASKVQTSTLGNRQVAACIARAVGRWRFRRPAGGGVVIATYPFVLRPKTASPKPPPSGIAGLVVRGLLGRAAVERVVKRGLARNRCLKHSSGSLVVSFKVDRRGRVARAKVDVRKGVGRLAAACVLRAVRRWRFPARRRARGWIAVVELPIAAATPLRPPPAPPSAGPAGPGQPQTGARRGIFSRAVIRRVIRRWNRRFRRCKGASKGGRIVVRITLGPRGRVRRARQVSSTASAVVARCVLRAVRRMRFPAPRGGGKLRLTLPVILR